MRGHYGEDFVYFTANDHQSVVRARGGPVSVAEDEREAHVVARERPVHQGCPFKFVQLHRIQLPGEIRRADQHPGVGAGRVTQFPKKPGQRDDRLADRVDQVTSVLSWHVEHEELVTCRELSVRDAESKNLQAVVVVVIVVQRYVGDTPVYAELGRHTPRLVALQIYAIAITPLLLRDDQESAEGDKSNAAERRVIRA